MARIRYIAIVAKDPEKTESLRRFKDPERNAVDLSQRKGWEVDVNLWERAS